MGDDRVNTHPPSIAVGGAGEPLPEARLERGEVLFYPEAPFPLPTGDDLSFLLKQQLRPGAHKNISFDPTTGRAAGFIQENAAQGQRLQALFVSFSRDTTHWLAQTLPRYGEVLRLDRVSYRPQEEATRRLRLKARNDLLHVDAFPSRPSGGARILRVFANVNPSEPRIWVTSEPFARLLQRYGVAAGLPSRSGPRLFGQLSEGVLGLFQPGRTRRTAYDQFMLRFHDYLKMNEDFQERGSKRLWTFPPGSAWLAMTDTCCHAVLRGRYALEHSYFVPESALALPAESPAALLKAACERAGNRRAA